MNMDLLNKTMDLEKECDRFLRAFNPDSLPRVVERGMKPILAGVANLINGSMLGMIDIAQVMVGKNKIVEGVVHIGVNQAGALIVIMTDTVGSVVRPPQAVTYEELMGMGVTSIQLVEGIKKFASGVIQNQMTHTKGSA